MSHGYVLDGTTPSCISVFYKLEQKMIEINANKIFPFRKNLFSKSWSSCLFFLAFLYLFIYFCVFSLCLIYHGLNSCSNLFLLTYGTFTEFFLLQQLIIEANLFFSFFSLDNKRTMTDMYGIVTLWVVQIFNGISVI